MSKQYEVKVGDLFKTKRVHGWHDSWNATAGYTVKVTRVTSVGYVNIQYIHHPKLNTRSYNDIKYRWVLPRCDINTGLERVSRQLEFSFMHK